MAASAPGCKGFLAISACASVLCFSEARAQTRVQYELPPKGIVDLVDTPPTPAVSLSPSGAKSEKQWMLIEHLSGLPSVADLAQPELRLAGLRFNPKTDGPSRGRHITALKLKALPDGPDKQ